MIRRIITLILFIGMAASCNSNHDKVKAEYSNYTFDKQVINKLPVYDSLAGAIIEIFPPFRNLINDKDSYRSYRYIPLSKNADVSKTLPPGASDKINQYFNQLGKDFIYGFEVFKDSTIKILIRSNYSGTLQVNIRENLSYYPPGHTIRRREYPVKDTVLNRSWQYWIAFEEQGIF